jgi:hypothetical protein
MYSWQPSVQKTKKLPNMSNPTFLQKRIDFPPSKISLFAGHEFSHQRDNIPYLKFYMKKVVLLIYRMMPRKLSYGGLITDFQAMASATVLGSSVLTTDAYTIGVIRF